MLEHVICITYLWEQHQTFQITSRKRRPSCANDSKTKFPTHGPTLKYLQGDKNSCIICLLASTLYECVDINASNYVYKRLKEIGELQIINRMVYLRDLMSGHHRMNGERSLKYQSML